MVRSRVEAAWPARRWLAALVAVLPLLAFLLGVTLRPQDGAVGEISLTLVSLEGAWAITGGLMAVLVFRGAEWRAGDGGLTAETLVDALPAPVWVARDGPAWQVVGNRAAREAFPSGDGMVTSLLDQCLASGRAVYDREVQIRSADGEDRQLFGQAAPVHDDGGALQGAVAVLVDVTARHRAATRQRERVERLRQALARAEAADRAQATFLASASHDLRQPFQAMRLYHHVLAIHVTASPALEVLGKLGEAMAAGEALLNALLDVSRFDAGNVEVRLEAVALDGLLASLATQMAPVARSKGLRLTVCQTMMVVRSDRVLLERVLRNIIDNALKYTDAGGVLVGCRRRGTTAQIQVWDTGMGIAPDKLERIFDDFYQIGNVDRDRERGLGLGLGIVRRTAALLGHRITAQSRPGRGSVFTIVLPLAGGDA